MEPPPQVDAKSLADYLEVMSKAVFQSGMSWKVVEAKWAGTREVFCDFDPKRLVTFTPEEIDEAANDSRIIRNRRKVEAIFHNAWQMLQVDSETKGGFPAWLKSFASFDEALQAIRSRFKFMGEMGTYYFLYVVKEPVPSHDEFTKQYGK